MRNAKQGNDLKALLSQIFIRGSERAYGINGGADIQVGGGSYKLTGFTRCQIYLIEHASNLQSVDRYNNY